MQLLKGLGDEAALVRAEYRRRGGDLNKTDLSLLCHALTAVEDRLEVEKPRNDARVRLRAKRRALELGLR
jgi:hypothetical protein